MPKESRYSTMNKPSTKHGHPIGKRMGYLIVSQSSPAKTKKPFISMLTTAREEGRKNDTKVGKTMAESRFPSAKKPPLRMLPMATETSDKVVKETAPMDYMMVTKVGKSTKTTKLGKIQPKTTVLEEDSVGTIPARTEKETKTNTRKTNTRKTPRNTSSDDATTDGKTKTKKTVSEDKSHKKLPKKKDKVDEKKAKRNVAQIEKKRRTCIKVCFGLIIVAVILAAAIGVTVYAVLYLLPPKNVPNGTEDYVIPNPIENSNASLPSMTKVCQKILRDKCAYFPDKFVSSCAEEWCSTVKLEPFLKIDSNRFEFREINSSELVVKVPDGTPCGESTSWCVKGQCQTTTDKRIEEYVRRNFVPVQGQWSSWSSTPECIASMSVNSTIDWKVYEKRSSCLSESPVRCNTYKYVFRSCTNPLPSAGGVPCWYNDGGTRLHMNKQNTWPIKLGDQCSGCADKDRDNHCPMDMTVITPCLQVRVAIQGAADNDFFFCCNADFGGKIYDGRCLLGYCTAFEFVQD